MLLNFCLTTEARNVVSLFSFFSIFSNSLTAQGFACEPFRYPIVCDNFCLFSVVPFTCFPFSLL